MAEAGSSVGTGAARSLTEPAPHADLLPRRSTPERRSTGSVDPRNDARQRLTTSAVLAVPSVGALVVSFLVTPDDIESGRVILSAPCMTRALFGVPCPSCGMTRAFTALSHGDLGLAWHYNPLAPGLYLLVWAIALWASLGVMFAWARLRKLPRAGHD